MLPTIRIFVSSPGDVYQERVAAERVILRLRDRYASDAVIVPVLWEHEPITANDTFQTQIPPPAECDIVVILLWARMGTRLPKSVAVDRQGSEYISGTAYEFWTSWEKYQQTGCPSILIYKKTSKFEPESDAADYLEKIAKQKRSLEDFMAKLLTEEGFPKHAYLMFDDVRRFEETFEVHLEKLIERKLFGEVSLHPTWQGNPFLGLRAFELKHSPVFCGRQVAVQRAFEQLKNRITSGVSSLLIVGASGRGKSSLARCGLTAIILASYPKMPFFVIRPGAVSPRTPTEFLAQQIEEAIPAVKPFRILELLRNNPAAVVNVLRGIRSESEDARLEPHFLLILDQLEELLTADFDADQRQQFSTAIELLVRSRTCICVGTLRSDYFSRLSEIPEFHHFIESGGLFDLQPPTRAEIGQMIRKPARAAGLHFEENRQTGQSLDDQIRDDAGDHLDILPLLEFTLDELYLRRSDSGQLTFDAYHGIGGIEGSVSRRATQVYEMLATGVQQALARVFRQLVTVSIEDGIAARQRCLDSNFDNDPGSRQFVDAFVEARLFTRDQLDGNSHVEIVHEALLNRWSPLIEWLQKESELLRMRSRLQESYQRWILNERRADLLLPQGKMLDEAEAVAAESDLLPYVNRRETLKFVAESREAVRSKRRLAAVSVLALGVFAIAASIAGVVAFKRGNALKQTIGVLENKQIELGSAKQSIEDLLTTETKLNQQLTKTNNDLVAANTEREEKAQELSDLSLERLEENVRISFDVASQAHARGETMQAFAAMHRAYKVDSDHPNFSARQPVHRRFLGLLGGRIAELQHCVSLQETVYGSWLDSKEQKVHLVTTAGQSNRVRYRALNLRTFEVEQRLAFDMPQPETLARCDVSSDGSTFVLTTVKRRESIIDLLRSEYQLSTNLRFFSTSDISRLFDISVDGLPVEMAFDPNGEFFVGIFGKKKDSDKQNQLVFLDILKKKSIRAFPSGEFDPVSATVEQGGSRVFILNGQGGIQSWSPTEQEQSFSTIAKSSAAVGLPVSALHVDSGIARLAVGGLNSATVISESDREGDQRGRSDVQIQLTGRCTGIEYLGSGKLLAIASHDDADLGSVDSRDAGTSSVRVVETKTFRPITRVFRGTTASTVFAVHEQSGLIAFVRDQGNIEIRQMTMPSAPIFLICAIPNEFVSWLDFSKDGDRLIAATAQGSLLSWDLTKDVFGRPLRDQVSADTRLARSGMRVFSIQNELLKQEKMSPLYDIPLHVDDSRVVCVNTMRNGEDGVEKFEDLSTVTVYDTHSMKQIGSPIKSKYSAEVCDLHSQTGLLCIGFRSGIASPTGAPEYIAERESILASIPNRAPAAGLRLLKFEEEWRDDGAISDIGENIVECKFSNDGDLLFVALGASVGGGKMVAVSTGDIKTVTSIADFDHPIWQFKVSSDSRILAVLTRNLELHLFRNQADKWFPTYQRAGVMAAAVSENCQRIVISTVNEELVILNQLTGEEQRQRAPDVRASTDDTDAGDVILLDWLNDAQILLVRDDGLVLTQRVVEETNTRDRNGAEYFFLDPSCRAADVDSDGVLTTLHKNGEIQHRAILPPVGMHMAFPPLQVEAISSAIDVSVKVTDSGLILVVGDFTTWISAIPCTEFEVEHSASSLFSPDISGRQQISAILTAGTSQSSLALAARLRGGIKFNEAEFSRLIGELPNYDPALVPEMFKNVISYSRELRKFDAAEQAFRQLANATLEHGTFPEIVDTLNDGWLPFPETVLEFIPLVKSKYAAFLASNEYGDVSTRTVLHYCSMGSTVRSGRFPEALLACKAFLSDAEAVRLEKSRKGAGIPFAYEQMYVAAREIGDVKAAEEALSWICKQLEGGFDNTVSRSAARIASHFEELKDFRGLMIAYFEKRLELGAVDASTDGWLGKMYARDGQAVKGLRFLERALVNEDALTTNGGDHRPSSLHLYLSLCHLLEGNHDLAFASLKTAEIALEQDVSKRDYGGKTTEDRRFEAIRDEIGRRLR
jgi:WD40 repeat protein